MHVFRRMCAVAAWVIFTGLATGCGGGLSFEHHDYSQSWQTDRVRVMTANVRVNTPIDLHNNWLFRRDLLVHTIRQFNPDILGTQETLPGQTDYLAANLPGYAYVGRGRGEGERSGEMCSIFYRSERFVCLDRGFFWLSEEPDRPGSRSWGLFPRMVSWAKLRTRELEPRDLYVFNAHFTIAGDDERARSAALMRQRIRRIAGEAATLVLGDFNDEPGSQAHRTLTLGHRVDDRPLVDVYRAVWPHVSRDENTLHGFGGDRAGDRIDWILSTDEFGPLAAKIDRTHDGGRYPSDHFPVAAVLQWKPGAPATASADREVARPANVVQ